MPMKTSELTGAALDWAVAKCEGYTCLHKTEGRMPHEPQLVMWPPRKAYGLVDLWELGYSTDWSQGGAIIEREKIDVMWCGDRWCAYTADAECTTGDDRQLVTEGNTPLIAAMRGYVTSKLGDEIKLPEELS
jgi:hypothetical protein